jgi:ABC-type hemin transport system ATPase subunit
MVPGRACHDHSQADAAKESIEKSVDCRTVTKGHLQVGYMRLSGWGERRVVVSGSLAQYTGTAVL